ncbi:hypothetical protein KAR91_03115 [Candidatus Pacearchaeota archaeon]|nr:hypothetical protein [Candidatus Pacearchaeota archaeon]
MPYFDETTSPHQDVTRLFEFQASSFQECLILASRNDSLGALIKAKSLDCVSRNTINNFFGLSEKELFSTLRSTEAEAVLLFRKEAGTVTAQQADSLISDAIASIPAWELRRKARNVKRRLLIALLCKHEGYSPDALKGAKIKVLLNLAESKSLVTKNK